VDQSARGRDIVTVTVVPHTILTYEAPQIVHLLVYILQKKTCNERATNDKEIHLTRLIRKYDQSNHNHDNGTMKKSRMNEKVSDPRLKLDFANTVTYLCP